MPPMFTRLLAQRLAQLTPLPVVEASDGLVAAPGTVVLAQGGAHLLAARAGDRVVLRLGDGPPENSCRPAADPLFRSAVQAWGCGTLAVVMTGMGRDGSAGAAAVRSAGGAVLAQDEQSSVVWGMPGAVVRAGLADAVLPLDDLAGEIAARVWRGRPGVGARGAA
jgi:two-component system chemotaxis response regulator CheB